MLCEHSKGSAPGTELRGHRYADSGSPDQDVPSGRKTAPAQAHACTVHPGTGPGATVEVEWVRGSVASELPQQEVRWGERGGGVRDTIRTTN